MKLQEKVTKQNQIKQATVVNQCRKRRENERKRIQKMRSLQKEMKEEHATNVAAIQEAFKSLSGCAVKYEGNEYPGEVKAI